MEVGPPGSAPGHPGHGPQYNFTRSVDGKTVNLCAKRIERCSEADGAAPALEKTGREVANYRAFLARVDQIVEVNEAICEARPISPLHMTGLSVSPGLRSMLDRVGETVPFAKASQLLGELPGIDVAVIEGWKGSHVRHEALLVRVGGRDPPPVCRSRPVKLRAA